MSMSKAADAFRTISEVADDLEIPKHVLRFWENKFPQIRPMKRGGGRRYYRPTDLELLRGIRHLLHNEGYTIKGVQKILREQGVDAVKSHGRGEDDGTPERGRELAAAPTASRKPPAKAGRKKRPGRPGAADPANVKAIIARVVGELKECRDLLASTSSATVAPAAKQARARR
jgi:DNA-binding transcriptional MerR regulator